HRYHNMFSLIVFNEDSKHAKAFCDPYGYNTSFFEHKYTHYQTWTGNDGKPNTLYNSMYYPTHQLTWYMQYHFGYDSLAAVEVCDSAVWRKEHPDTTGPGVKEANSIIESIYPNPASDYVVVSLKNNDQAAIRIVNVMGQVMKTVYTTEEKNRISTKDLSAGIYFLSVEQNGKRYSTKLTIR
ncbi:MAG: T9SS type A sorting domain-containing protein, partial [Bacteroidales bacterium]|nr:T9SS type A sorting domain-containing protein [Bacteroidales bacterium]